MLDFLAFGSPICPYSLRGMLTGVRARYSWDMGDLGFYVEGRAQISSSSYSSILTSERFPQRAYAIAGLTAGVSKGPWSALLYVDNLFDKRADASPNVRERQVACFRAGWSSSSWQTSPRRS